MTKIEIVAVLIGVFGLYIMSSYVSSKETEKVAKESPKTKHYEYENVDTHHKMKVFKHQTWYGDTMLVTVDTTYFY